jgi:hypothetical protein
VRDVAYALESSGDLFSVRLKLCSSAAFTLSSSVSHLTASAIIIGWRALKRAIGAIIRRWITAGSRAMWAAGGKDDLDMVGTACLMSGANIFDVIRATLRRLKTVRQAVPIQKLSGIRTQKPSLVARMNLFQSIHHNVKNCNNFINAIACKNKGRPTIR